MILHGDCRTVMREQLEPESFHTCVTSPPYWGLRDYGIPASEWPEVTYTPMAGLPSITVPAWTGCLGLEPTPEMFVGHMVLVFREVWRVLRADGTLWLNFGDSYASGGRGGGGSFMDERKAWKDKSEVRGWRSPPPGLKNKERRFVGKMINCHWCAGMWIAAAVILAGWNFYGWFIQVYAILAAAAVLSLIETIWTKAVGFPEMQEKGGVQG